MQAVRTQSPERGRARSRVLERPQWTVRETPVRAISLRHFVSAQQPMAPLAVRQALLWRLMVATQRQ
jgi:hypothetical protein